MSPYPYPRLTGWTVAGRLIGGGLALALALCLVGWTIVNLVPTSWLNAEADVSEWFEAHRTAALDMATQIGSDLAGTYTCIAVLVVALTVVVGSFDGDVLQPLVMGKAVSLHPLAIVFAIAAGGIAMGIVGALIAVPVAGAVYSVAKYLTGRDPHHPYPAPPEPESPPALTA